MKKSVLRVADKNPPSAPTSKNTAKVALLLCAMLLFVPALGFPNEELLQDTLKSMLVAFFAIGAAGVYFWQLHRTMGTVQWHALLALPGLLLVYALGSMHWSHAYLAGVEAVRWFVFTLIVFVGINNWSMERANTLLWSIHLGAVIAAIWGALQFWIDFSLFAQGPNPASTFVNRNFFGEFLVCTLPFSALLLMRVKDKTSVFFLSFSLGFNIVALMMTGTRSALLGLLLLIPLLPGIAYVCRKQIVSANWRPLHGAALLAVFGVSVFLLGSIPTTNPKIIKETGPTNALQRALTRTVSLSESKEYTEGSFSVRAVMWKATGRMIQANPVFGVGAGAWEIHAPVYQEAGKQLETDYFAHNEFLQLVSEYGLLGWFFLLGLFSYLAWAGYLTWSRHHEPETGAREAPLRATALTSLLMLMLVSNAGFPWRMAATGALFAVCLGILGASDLRLLSNPKRISWATRWSQRLSIWALLGTGLCLCLALFISQQAIECESKLVRAIKIALTIAQSPAPNDPGWAPAKADMLVLVSEGIAINPHYRKLTPMVADSLANWGDWKNATWIWESVLESRPYVIALLANISRGYIQAHDYAKAEELLARAKALQPGDANVASLEVALLSRNGQESKAAELAKKLLQAQVADHDLVRTAYYLGMRLRDPELAIMALEFRIKSWPKEAVDGWLKLGQIYDSIEAKDEARALDCYRAAVKAARKEHKTAILAMIPRHYHAQID